MKNILVITFWSYKDALVQTYTLPYINLIREILPRHTKIFIVTFEQSRIALTNDEVQKINFDLNQKNIQVLAFPYKKFGIKKLIDALGHLMSMIKLIKKQNIHTIHAFGPNAGSYGYLLSKITGRTLIIDSFEPHAEAMVENGTWRKNRGAHLILSKFEKWQAKRAKHLIATTSNMYGYSKKTYGYSPKSFFVKPACVDTSVFFPRDKDEKLVKEFNLFDKIVCVYAGKLGGIYLNEEVFDFLKVCYKYWGGKFRCIMVTNTERKEIEEQIKRAGIPHDVIISRFVYHFEVPRYLSLGDFAINPVKPVPSKRYCTSIKDGEYWAMGLPIVITPNISDDSDIITNNKIGAVLNGFDEPNILKAIEIIDSLIKKDRGELQDKIVEIAKKYRSYTIAAEIYRIIYNTN